MVLAINHMMLTALILGSIAGCAAQIATPITGEGLEAMTCFPYTCKKSKQTFTSETCVYYDAASETFYSKDSACTATGRVCTPSPYATANWTCTVPPPKIASALVGEYCETFADCISPYSSACTCNVCVAAYAYACLTAGFRDDKWCPAGQYCSVTTLGGVTIGTCVAQVAVGRACSMDWDCVNNAGCNIAGGAGSGTCVAYFSISSGEEFANCPATTEGTYAQSLFCESTLCGTVNGVGKCLDAVKTKGSLPVKCTSPSNAAVNSECLTKKDSVSGMKLSNSCTCGLNKSGNAYCDLSPGDSYFQSYLKYIKKWLSSPGINKCNTEGRFDSLCQKAQWSKKNIQAWTYYNLLVNSYPEIINSEDCVLTNFAPAYVEAKKAYDSSASFLEKMLE